MIVRADFQPDHPVDFRIARGQHEDGDVRFPPQNPADFEAVEAGQHDVEEDEIRVEITGGLDGLAAVAHHLDAVPLVAQVVFEGRFILDDQDFGGLGWIPPA